MIKIKGDLINPDGGSRRSEEHTVSHRARFRRSHSRRDSLEHALIKFSK